MTDSHVYMFQQKKAHLCDSMYAWAHRINSMDSFPVAYGDFFGTTYDIDIQKSMSKVQAHRWALRMTWIKSNPDMNPQLPFA